MPHQCSVRLWAFHTSSFLLRFECRAETHRTAPVNMDDLEWRLTDLKEHFSLPDFTATAAVEAPLRHSVSSFCAAVDAIAAAEAVPLAGLRARLQLQDKVEETLAPRAAGAVILDGAVALAAMRSADPVAHAATVACRPDGSTPACLPAALTSESAIDGGVGAELAQLVRLEAAAMRVCLQLVRLRVTGAPAAAHRSAKKGADTAAADAEEAFRSKYKELRERERALIAARALLAKKEAEVVTREERARAAAEVNARTAAALRGRESRVLARERELCLTPERGPLDSFESSSAAQATTQT